MHQLINNKTLMILRCMVRVWKPATLFVDNALCRYEAVVEGYLCFSQYCSLNQWAWTFLFFCQTVTECLSISWLHNQWNFFVIPSRAIACKFTSTYGLYMEIIARNFNCPIFSLTPYRTSVFIISYHRNCQCGWR